SVTVDYQQGGSVINLSQGLYDDGKTTADYGTPAFDKRFHDFFLNGVITPYIERATFVKLREVSVNWSLPRRWIKAVGWGITDLRIALTGRDLLWYTPYSGLDPEVADFGAASIRNNLDIVPYP